MEILPAVDIRGGRAVRLIQGDYGRETVFNDDPTAAARRWIDEGAERLHIVDLDGAREGAPVNAAAIERIAGLGAPIQVGGGVRGIDAFERYIEIGAERVIIGTAAVTDRVFLAAAIERARNRSSSRSTPATGRPRWTAGPGRADSPRRTSRASWRTRASGGSSTPTSRATGCWAGTMRPRSPRSRGRPDNR